MKTKRALSKVLPPQRHHGLLLLFIPTGFLGSSQPYCTDLFPWQAAGVGCSNHPSHPSLSVVLGWEERESSLGQSDQPLSQRASTKPRPGLEPKQARGFRTSSRNREAPTQLLLLLPFSPAAWTSHGPWGNPGFPDSSTRRGCKRIWRFLPLHLPQRGC